MKHDPSSTIIVQAIYNLHLQNWLRLKHDLLLKVDKNCDFPMLVFRGGNSISNPRPNIWNGIIHFYRAIDSTDRTPRPGKGFNLIFTLSRFFYFLGGDTTKTLKTGQEASFAVD